ncbi:hypothetical protein [Nocardia jejuensis]|uniref:hypothetical protein n=1 Tax=Nocardia jejuensis TaxID=328049 RepID=UPI00159C7437|nr:hypothetical protein [Nocardia jejuensis]
MAVVAVPSAITLVGAMGTASAQPVADAQQVSVQPGANPAVAEAGSAPAVQPLAYYLPAVHEVSGAEISNGVQPAAYYVQPIAYYTPQDNGAVIGGGIGAGVGAVGAGVVGAGIGALIGGLVGAPVAGFGAIPGALIGGAIGAVVGVAVGTAGGGALGAGTGAGIATQDLTVFPFIL